MMFDESLVYKWAIAQPKETFRKLSPSKLERLADFFSSYMTYKFVLGGDLSGKTDLDIEYARIEFKEMKQKEATATFKKDLRYASQMYVAFKRLIESRFDFFLTKHHISEWYLTYLKQEKLKAAAEEKKKFDEALAKQRENEEQLLKNKKRLTPVQIINFSDFKKVKVS